MVSQIISFQLSTKSKLLEVLYIHDLLLDDSTLKLGTQTMKVWRVQAKAFSLENREWMEEARNLNP